MIKILIHIAFLIVLSCLGASAQVERLRIETYYISDAMDATDTIGGHLAEGSTTYRIYADLLPDSKLISIYGDANHPLVFSSTAPFFNHVEEGITFGKDLSRNRYEIGTVALDSYITLGQCSRSFSQGAYFGVPKVYDQDGSVIGGTNNDGGSAAIATGLLLNDNSQIGVTLTIADGLALTNQVPGAWVGIGFIDPISQLDTTIFGSTDPKNVFNRTDVTLRNDGIVGVDPLENEILIAQLTTKGDLSFSINLEVEIFEEGVTKTVKYVSRNEKLGDNEIFAALLTYPYTCGCKDPDYLEADPAFACEDNTQCKTPIIFGCTDSLACNFNQEANYNLQDLCCYVGYCNDLDISLVCPDLRPRSGNSTMEVSVYPNPVVSDLNLDIDHSVYADIEYTLYDMYGRIVMENVISAQEKSIDVTGLLPGYYGIRLKVLDDVYVVSFVKI